MNLYNPKPTVHTAPPALLPALVAVAIVVAVSMVLGWGLSELINLWCTP